jgi:transposase-like protein
MRFNRMATELAGTISQKEFAQAIEVVPRTLRNWRKRQQTEDQPKLGRPAHDERAHRNAFWKTAREYLRQGRPGSRSIVKALVGTAPTRLVQLYVKELKALDRKRSRKRILSRRQCVEVLAKNALWTQDSAQVARDADGAIANGC